MALQPVNVANTSGSQTMTNAFITANWTNALQFLMSPPIFIGFNTSAQGLASGSGGAAVQWTGETADTYSGHSNTTNPSRYVGQAPGWYWVSGSICFTGNTAGSRKAWISVNGTPVANTNVQGPPCLSSSDATTLAVPAMLVELNGSTDYVEIWAAQTSGSSLNLNPNATNASGITVAWAHM
jgi:hypothetical protein